MPAMHGRSSIALWICAAFAAAGLSGCSSDDTTARFLVAPDKYVLYSCPEIAREMTGLVAREKELRGLMVKAGTDVGDRMISSLAYDSEYLSIHGSINDLRASAAERHCPAPPGAAAH
jgi:hypothetical protein